MIDQSSASVRSNKFFYGWIIVIVSTLALMVSNGLSVGGVPVFYKPMLADLVVLKTVAPDKAQSVVGTAASLTFLCAGLFSPVAGFLVQRIGLRVLMCAGSVILGSALFFYSRATAPVHVYISHSMFGLSLGLVGVMAQTVLISNWFRKMRGTAMGIVLTGTSFGGALIPLLATPLILRFGWRTAMLMVSMLIWCVLLPAITLLVHTHPKDKGLAPDGDTTAREETATGPASLSGMTLGEAIRTPIFWIFALCAALIFYPIFSISQQFILHLQTPRIGLKPEQVGFVQAALFATSVAGKFLFGWLSDRFRPTRVLLICCSTMFLATLVLLFLKASTVFLFLVPFALGWGGTFVLVQLLVAEYFGLKHLGPILGTIMVIETIGGSAGTFITGKLADAHGGDYTVAFNGLIVATALALMLSVLLNFLAKKKEALA